MEETKIKLKGKSNIGANQNERTEEFTIKKVSDSVLQIFDSKGKRLISFNPFFDGGSICINDFSSIIVDVKRLDNNKKLVHSETISTSSLGLQQLKRDSENLSKIREANRLLNEEE